MENCKYCHQELDEGSTLCPHCGRDNAETPVTETVEENVPETVEETAPVTEAVEAPAEAESSAEVQTRKVTPGKIALAVAAIVVLLGILIALIMVGTNTAKPVEEGTEETAEATVVATIPEDGNPDDVTCKGSYTAANDEAAAARDIVVATINGRELTNGQLQVHYWSAVNSFLSSEQGYYVMMYGGINYAQPLDTQRCALDEKVTWQQHFLQQALNSWQTSTGLAGEAEKAGMEMGEEELEFLANIEADLEQTAASYGMDVEELMHRNVGYGAGVEEFKAFQELYAQGAGYYSAEFEKMVPTEEELEAFFDERAEGYATTGVTKDGNFVDVRHILVTVKEDETAETTGETTSETTEAVVSDAWKVCEEEAQAILDAWLAGDKTEESFAALANEKSEDPGSNTTGGLYENVYLGQMVKPFEDWCFEENRKTGDTGLVKTDYGYHVMYFVDSTPQWTYYAERDWVGEQVSQLLKTLAEKYPMDVEYDKILLGNLQTDE